jgi:hypothetical protein
VPIALLGPILLMPGAVIAGVVVATILTAWPEYQRLALNPGRSDMSATIAS